MGRFDRILERHRMVQLDDLDNQRPSWRLPVAFASVVGLLAISLWAWVGQLDGAAQGATISRLELDSVAGLDVAAAEAKLLKLGFIVNVAYLPSEGQARGIVFGQDPVAGAKVEQGDIITLSVSDGEAGRAVPSVVGQQLAEAQALLVSNGFSVSPTTVASETTPVGEVIMTTPEAGGRVPIGGSVTIVASSGSPQRPVPELVGKPINQVMIDLGRSGLGIGTISRTTNSDQPVGTVIASDPAVGTPVARDYPVKITVVDEPGQTVVPFVIGIRQSSAETSLRANGLTSTVFLVGAAAGQAPGTVLAQSFPGGAPVAFGTAVQITVAAGPPPAPPTTAPPPTSTKPK